MWKWFFQELYGKKGTYITLTAALMTNFGINPAKVHWKSENSIWIEYFYKWFCE